MVAIDGDIAVVDAAGHRFRASALSVPDVRPGDWVLLGAGTVVRIVDPDAAAELAAAFRTANGERS